MKSQIKPDVLFIWRIIHYPYISKKENINSGFKNNILKFTVLNIINNKKKVLLFINVPHLFFVVF
jgi:hypothetical protein